MREKIMFEEVVSQIKYEENKLLSFHRSSTDTTSYRVYEDGKAGIHYQVGKMSDEEGFALAEAMSLEDFANITNIVTKM